MAGLGVVWNWAGTIRVILVVLAYLLLSGTAWALLRCLDLYGALFATCDCLQLSKAVRGWSRTGLGMV